MQSPAIQSALDTLIDTIRAELRSEFIGFLGGQAAQPAKRRPGRPAKAAAAPKANGRAKGAKRTPEELEQLTKNLLAAIKKSPGEGIETLGKTLGVRTKELALPVSKLFEAKSIKSTGQKRATKYFPK